MKKFTYLYVQMWIMNTMKNTTTQPQALLANDKVTNEDGSKDLRRPVHEIVKATCTDGE
jgi:hypothetical protein